MCNSSLTSQPCGRVSHRGETPLGLWTVRLSLSSSCQAPFLPLVGTPESVKVGYFHLHSLRSAPTKGIWPRCCWCQRAPGCSPVPWPCPAPGPGFSPPATLSPRSAAASRLLPSLQTKPASLQLAPAASRRARVLMYAFPDACAAGGAAGPLLEHPFPYPPLKGSVPV